MKYFSLLILLYVNQQLFAQEPLFTNFHRYYVENGLPQNLVTGIVQDEDGFIWVSTMDGLARYDGKEFLVFRHKPGDSTSLLSNNLNALFLDRHNKLWIQSNHLAINQMDPKTFDITEPTSGASRSYELLTKNLGGTRNGFCGNGRMVTNFAKK